RRSRHLFQDFTPLQSLVHGSSLIAWDAGLGRQNARTHYPLFATHCLRSKISTGRLNHPCQHLCPSVEADLVPETKTGPPVSALPAATSRSSPSLASSTPAPYSEGQSRLRRERHCDPTLARSLAAHRCP